MSLPSKSSPVVTFFPETFPDGPWGVDTIGDSWYVIHKLTGRKKRIGRVIGIKSVSSRRPNYFDRALEEAARRNRTEAAGAGV